MSLGHQEECGPGLTLGQLSRPHSQHQVADVDTTDTQLAEVGSEPLTIL